MCCFICIYVFIYIYIYIYIYMYIPTGPVTHGLLPSEDRFCLSLVPGDPGFERVQTSRGLAASRGGKKA